MPASIDGVLVVDKPVGPTSHDVVARVRRATGCRRIGHTGTLDPLASGVLALVAGRATRLAQYLSAGDKRYDATFRLGIETDTYDALGTLVPRSGSDGPAPAAWPGRDEIVAALTGFRGEFEQSPPAFSAKKIGGVRAYALARREQPARLEAVSVRVDDLEVLEVRDDVVRVDLTCSAGFYVRSLAHDLGRVLGCGAHLVALRRLRSGEFDVTTAVTLEVLEVDPDEALRHLVPMEHLLPSLPAARLTARGAARAAHGNPVEPEEVDGWMLSGPGPETTAPPVRLDVTGRVRLLAPDGRLLGLAAVGERAGWPLRPAVVLV